MEKIHLVSSSSIEALSKNKKNILLGGWCYDYQNKNQYKFFDYEILKSPSVCMWEEKNADVVNQGREQIERLIKDFSLILNKLHKVNFNQKYWSILLRPWINNIVDFYYVVSQRLSFISKNYIIESATFNFFDDEIDLPNHYNEGIKFLGKENHYFNHLVFQIFENYDFENVKINFVNLQKKQLRNKSELRDFEKNTIKGKIRNILLNFFDFFPLLDNRPFIIGSVLPYYEDFLLKISNLQSPKNISFTPIEKISIKFSQRDSSYISIPKEDLHNLISNSLIFKIVYKYLPTCYLEGYHLNRKKMLMKKWPKNPKYIFTSVNHYFDEIFKFYAAEKVEKKNTPLYLGQHGQGYCSHRYFWLHPEIANSKKFLVWGEKKVSKNSEILFNIRKPRKMNKYKLSSKGILLITEAAEEITPLFSSLYDYQLEKFDFLSNLVDSLNYELKKELTIRLYHDRTNDFCYEEKKWRDLYPDIKLDLRHRPLKNLISNNKIIIFGYDSTGFLENISQNIPSLLYFHENDFEKMLDKKTTEDFLELKKANILFNNHLELSNHINKIWNDLDSWWNSKTIVSAVHNFRIKYCKTVKYPIAKLNNILN